MPDPTRYAGYASPRELAVDTSLTPQQKIDALKAWRSSVLRHPPRADGGLWRQSLLEAIEAALRGVRG